MNKDIKGFTIGGMTVGITSLIAYGWGFTGLPELPPEGLGFIAAFVAYGVYRALPDGAKKAVDDAPATK